MYVYTCISNCYTSYGLCTHTHAHTHTHITVSTMNYVVVMLVCVCAAWCGGRGESSVEGQTAPDAAKQCTSWSQGEDPTCKWVLCVCSWSQSLPLSPAHTLGNPKVTRRQWSSSTDLEAPNVAVSHLIHTHTHTHTHTHIHTHTHTHTH